MATANRDRPDGVASRGDEPTRAPAPSADRMTPNRRSAADPSVAKIAPPPRSGRSEQVDRADEQRIVRRGLSRQTVATPSANDEKMPLLPPAFSRFRRTAGSLIMPRVIAEARKLAASSANTTAMPVASATAAVAGSPLPRTRSELRPPRPDEERELRGALDDGVAGLQTVRSYEPGIIAD